MDSSSPARSCRKTTLLSQKKKKRKKKSEQPGERGAAKKKKPLLFKKHGRNKEAVSRTYEFSEITRYMVKEFSARSLKHVFIVLAYYFCCARLQLDGYAVFFFQFLLYEYIMILFLIYVFCNLHANIFFCTYFQSDPHNEYVQESRADGETMGLNFNAYLLFLLSFLFIRSCWFTTLFTELDCADTL